MERHPMGVMDDGVEIERQASHGDPENNAKATKASWIPLLISVLIVVPIVASISALVFYYGVDAHYSVAIDSASALVDPRTGVSFNLTLGVASRSHGAKACIEPGMFIVVSYHGVQVAASNGAEARRTCARPRNVAELPVVARATMTPVGGALDSLAAEMVRGAALFDLRLLAPATRRNGEAYLSASDCKRSRVGDSAMPCSCP